MKVAKACRNCRLGKRKCNRETPATPCEACTRRQLICPGLPRLRGKRTVALIPKAPDPDAEQDTVPERSDPASLLTVDFTLSREMAVEFVRLYLDKIHDRPHSLFHPSTLLKQVGDDALDRALLYAICACGCRFSPRGEARALEAPLTAKSKALFLADLENICLENIQTSILLANLSASNCNHSSEALFFRIANSMAEIMRLNTCISSSSLIIRETSRRIWWTLYMADRWCFSGLALPRQIKDSDPSPDLPMDEAVFRALSADSLPSDLTWKPGLWAHMSTLVRLFGPIQDLNRRSANGDADADLDELNRLVGSLSRQLDAWQESLPVDAQMNLTNLEMQQAQGTGGPFVALHLGYHHYATLLYFRFLEERGGGVDQTYVTRCKYHASAFSRLLGHARRRKACEAVYHTVGHMAVVSSSVLLYTLLFGEESELDAAREALEANFEVLIELRQYWPTTSSMINRLITFQNICLLSTGFETHRLDGWMVRFLIEHSLPLDERRMRVVPHGVYMDEEAMLSKTEQLTRQGRYTDFGLL